MIKGIPICDVHQHAATATTQNHGSIRLADRRLQVIVSQAVRGLREVWASFPARPECRFHTKGKIRHLPTTCPPRAYQREALAAVRDAYKAGKRRVIVSLPTGTGKTLVFAHFPRVFNMKKRLLVLAHREELLLQARDKFRSIDPELKAEIEQAGAHATADAKVVIASVPTLARGGARLAAVPAG